MPKEVRVDLTPGQVLRVFSKTRLTGGINGSKLTATINAAGTYVEPLPPAGTDAVPTITNGPSVSSISQTEARIVWSLSEKGTGQVEYRTIGGATKVTPAELTLNYTAHAQTISGLTPDTQYEYRVVGNDSAHQGYASAWLTFRTLKPETVPPPPTGLVYPPDTTLRAVPVNNDPMPGGTA